MTDKDFCSSSFLALRYIEKDDAVFVDGMPRQHYRRFPDYAKTLIGDEHDLDIALSNVFRSISGERLGMLLSGGMDSSILASYMPEGSDAYTFRFLGGSFQEEELHRAEFFASRNKLNLHYVDIDWSVVEECLPAVMKAKGAPVHSIEPQICHAAIQAQRDGVTLMVIGDGADYVFGGMDGLYSKNWTFDEFVKRYIYVDPAEILVNPVSMDYLFERYRLGPSSIDFIRLMDDITMDESYATYENAFEAAGMPFIDPYDKLKMSRPLDLARLRNGESKYIIRALFKLRYPDLPVPQKLPMPRPVDQYFSDWKGPRRPEFRTDIDITKYTGNQKWLIWCLERFLDDYCPNE